MIPPHSHDSSHAKMEGPAVCHRQFSEQKFSYLSKWVAICLEECKLKNKRSCASDGIGQFAPGMKLNFIHVGDLNITSLLPSPLDYVAISYVWGAVSQLQLSTSNHAELSQPGALLSHQSSIPRTVWQAIELTKALGFDYLWVDSLCIVQDDADKKHAAIAQMGAVYNAATLTLVVLNESADQDIPLSTTPVSEPSEKEAERMIMAGARQSRVSKHFSRGWTYQERILSRRKLYLTPTGTFWACRSIIRPQSCVGGWHSTHSDSFGDNLPMNLSLGRTTGHYLTHFLDAVEAYSSRSLSFASDRLAAFTGIISVFESRLGWNISAGLTHAALPLCLRWHGNGLLVRNPQFPSWSWAGWTGAISYADVLSPRSGLPVYDSKIGCITFCRKMELQIDDKLCDVLTGLSVRLQGGAKSKFIMNGVLEVESEARKLSSDYHRDHSAVASLARRDPSRLRLHFRASFTGGTGLAKIEMRQRPTSSAEPDGVITMLLQNGEPIGFLWGEMEHLRHQMGSPDRWGLVTTGTRAAVSSAFNWYAEGTNKSVDIFSRVIRDIMVIRRPDGEGAGQEVWERVAIGNLDMDVWTGQPWLVEEIWVV
ncbi:heterokaryon incompatibility protein-domain-containing protein [Echria macrotheca]|uniref:Heterokaryon incompatibility protein-domain-containing protein n=1 Tax=Echria macrotheca TaxID=438768 RepID=A0AAJ0BKF1_9PEZI|nr:heterokaryon incompatibility protein-domain-containing protein [Echria macrotheca]